MPRYRRPKTKAKGSKNKRPPGNSKPKPMKKNGSSIGKAIKAIPGAVEAFYIGKKRKERQLKGYAY